jgi:hypothetical protein
MVVDDAGTVDPHSFQLEAGSLYGHGGTTDHFDFPLTLNYGVVPSLQIGIDSGGQVERRNPSHDVGQTIGDFDDLALNAKWNPVTANRFSADQSVSFSVTIPVAHADRDMGSDETDIELMYIATKALTKTVNADGNFGYTWVGGNLDLWHYGIELRWQATEPLEWVAKCSRKLPRPVSTRQARVECRRTLDGGGRLGARCNRRHWLAR